MCKKFCKCFHRSVKNENKYSIGTVKNKFLPVGKRRQQQALAVYCSLKKHKASAEYAVGTRRLAPAEIFEASSFHQQWTSNQ